MIGALLFFHLVAAVLIFAGLGIELAALVLLHRARTLGQVRSAVSAMPMVGPLMISGVIVLLAAGISLVYAGGYGWQAWDVVALALTVVLAITGKAVNGARGEAIVVMVQHAGEGSIPAAVDTARRDPLWNYAILFSTCQLIALLYIMSSKPSLAMSLGAVIVAALLAFVPTVLVLRRVSNMREAEMT